MLPFDPNFVIFVSYLGKNSTAAQLQLKKNVQKLKSPKDKNHTVAAKNKALNLTVAPGDIEAIFGSGTSGKLVKFLHI